MPLKTKRPLTFPRAPAEVKLKTSPSICATSVSYGALERPNRWFDGALLRPE